MTTFICDAYIHGLIEVKITQTTFVQLNLTFPCVLSCGGVSIFLIKRFILFSFYLMHVVRICAVHLSMATLRETQELSKARMQETDLQQKAEKISLYVVSPAISARVNG